MYRTCILVTVTELGKFHGVLYALKHTDRTAFDQLKQKLIETRFSNLPSKQWAQRLNLGIKRATKTVRDHPDTKQLIPEAFLNRLETLMENVFSYQKKMVVSKEPLAIVAHGDYLRNNLAFKYNSEKVSVLQ